MNHQWLHSAAAVAWRYKLLLGLWLLPMALVSFFVGEHVRGRMALSHYVRVMSARGEKMNPRDFRQQLPPGENGAPEVLEAAKDLKEGAILPKIYPPRMKLTPSGHAVVCFREEEWIEDKATNHWEQLATDLAANADTLKRIRAAVAKPVLSCDFNPSLGPLAQFPHLPIPKRLTTWFGSSIQLGLHAGRPHEVVPDLVTEIDLARLLERDGIVISELVRGAIAAIARFDTWEALQSDGWTDPDLVAIQQAWERQDFADSMVRALEGERVFAESTYQLMRESNQQTADIFFAMEQFLPEGERAKWEQTFSDLPGGEAVADFLKKQVYCRLWRFAWLDQDHLHYLKYLQRMIELARDAAHEKSLRKVEPEVKDLVLKFQNRGGYDRLRFHCEISVDSLSRVLTRAMRAQTERSLVLSAIGLKRYGLRHSAAPASLGALVPECLTSLPLDCMDGEALRFRQQPDGGFVLYSVGEDGKDDGGDAGIAPGKTNLRNIWERKDVVWPAPATADEVEAYRVESAKN